MPFTGGSYSRTKTFSNAGTMLPADLNSIQDDIGGQLNTALIRAGVSDSTVVRRGKSVIATSETRSNVAYGLLTTPDRVSSVVLPTDGLLFVRYRALVKTSGPTAEVAIFVGANQLKTLKPNAVPAVLEQSLGINEDFFSALYTNKLYGLAVDSSSTVDTSLVTTGFVTGAGNPAANQGEDTLCIEGLPGGTYDVSVQYKTSGGVTVTSKERKLAVWTMGF